MMSFVAFSTFITATALEMFAEGVTIVIACYAVTKGAKNAINLKK